MNRMPTRIATVAAGVALLAAASFHTAPQAAAATGPYTLPFFDPGYVVTQPFGCTGYPAEPPYGSCAHWHGGIDYNLAYAPVAASRAGTVVRILEAVGHDVHNDPRGGNYLLIDHGDSRYSLYYHLEYNGVYPGINTTVSAGQHVAQSGNTGSSSAPHLHYALTKSIDWWVTANALNPAGKWTTDPGRVPWLAVYYSESNDGTEYITRGTTRTHWVRFRNGGGRTWTRANDGFGRGRILLAAVAADGTTLRSSPFRASDWTSEWLATSLEESSVAPGAIGTFTFGLHAAPPVGFYTETFNIRASGLWWFDYARLGRYYVPIQVVTASTCSLCL